MDAGVIGMGYAGMPAAALFCGCAVHYPIPLPRQPLYAGAATCPVAEALAASVLSIPVHPNITDEERAYVARTINGVISMDAGVIGTGTMGRNHARVYSELKEVGTTYIYDLNTKAAEEVAAATGAEPVSPDRILWIPWCSLSP